MGVIGIIRQERITAIKMKKLLTVIITMEKLMKRLIMKRFGILFVILLLAATSIALSVAQAEQRLVIKYRPTTVDVDKPYFEYLNTLRSSFVRGAWYDKKNRYMIINLSGTNYHYCGVEEGTWKVFKSSPSFGKAYNSMFKGRFDCRINPVPTYSK